MTTTPPAPPADRYTDRINADRIRADGKPTAYRGAEGGHALLLSRSSSVGRAPVLVARTADPDGHPFDDSPHVVMDRAAVEAMVAAGRAWLDATAPPAVDAVMVARVDGLAPGEKCCCGCTLTDPGTVHGPRACYNPGPSDQ